MAVVLRTSPVYSNRGGQANGLLRVDSNRGGQADGQLRVLLTVAVVPTDLAGRLQPWRSRRRSSPSRSNRGGQADGQLRVIVTVAVEPTVYSGPV